MTLVHDVSTHRRGSRLAVGTSNTQSLVLTGQRTQYLCTLLYLETILTEINEFLMVGRDGWCIDDETVLLLTTSMWYLVDILLIVDEHAFFLQLAGQRTGCLVVAGNDQATLDEITGDGTHADATGSYEIYCFDIFQFH